MKNTAMPLITGAIVGLMFFAFAGFAFGHDHNHPELGEWYRSLESRKGPCCGGPNEDATSLSDLQWRTKDKAYEVFVEGQWVAAPEETLVKVPNITGGAKVWLYHFNGMPAVRCFMPGTMG